MLVTIGGEAVKAMEGSLNVDDAIGERSTASFVVHSEPGVHYQQGQPVEIYNHVPRTPPSALVFNGTGAHVRINRNIPGMGVEGGVELWFRVDPSSTGGFIYSSDTNLRTYINTTANQVVFWKGDPGVTIAAVTGYKDNQWHHAALMWEAGVGYAYIDGVLVGSAPFLDTRDGNNVAIAALRATWDQFARCDVDEVREWEARRTPEQIKANMHRELVGNEPGLVGYWKFNEPGINPVTANYVGKVSGSTVENPHIAKYNGNTGMSLRPPSEQVFEPDQTVTYNNISSLDGAVWSRATSNNGAIAQSMFSFDLIQLAIRERGVPLNTMTTADAVAWLKANIRSFMVNWNGFGSGPSGNRARLARWNPVTSSWVGGDINTNTSGAVAKLSAAVSTPSTAIDANGFFHALAYTDASNGAIASTINTDYVELYVEFINTAIDSSPSGNNGTIIGASYTTDAPELPTPELIFAGLIDKPAERLLPGIHGRITHAISCKDWHYLADKRIVAKAYSQTAAGDIVEDLIATRLADEGITAGDIADGPIINEAVFNYVPVSKALDRLAEKAGFVWYVDYDRTLHFRPRANLTAPWEILGADIYAGVQVEHGNPQYRNTQYIKGGTDITDPQTQSFKGDGTVQSFALGFKVAKVPTITVKTGAGSPVAQTVGIRGLDTGKQWYWNKGDPIISQDTDATPLTTDQILTVTYQGEFAIVAISKDGAEIVTRQDLELNSGIVEDVQDEPQTTNREAAFESAAALLKRYAIIGRRVKFRTRRPGLFAGQIALVTLPEHDLFQTEMLIESVTISEGEGHVYYSVSAVEGPELGSWTRMFERIATRGEAFVIRENINEEEILVTLEQFSESATWSEAWNDTVFACPIPSTALYPSTTLYPC